MSPPPRAPAHPKRISTEALLTSPHGFGITTATVAQRAICRVLDGLPLGDIATNPDVVGLVGGPEALAALPSEIGIQPTEVAVVAAIRTAKSITGCAVALRASQSVDVSRLGPGEIPRVSIVSLDLDKANAAFRILVETVRASHILRPLVVGEPTASSLTLRHPSGRPIEISCVAGARAGGGLVATWSASVVFDEAPRMSGGDSVVSLSDARAAVLGRLLPRAQVIYIGSAWSPHGPVYDFVSQHWGRPSEHMVILRATGPMLNPVWWTPTRCARLLEANPASHRTDVLGEFCDPESGLLDPIAITRSTREGPLELIHDRASNYFAAVDPSEGTARGNGFSLVIVEEFFRERPLDLGPFTTKRRPRGLPTFRIAVAREWRGVSPAGCWREIAKLCKSYGIREAITDQYAASANSDLAKLYGLNLTVERANATSKVEDFTNLQTLLHTDRIELSPDKTLLNDLRSVKKRATQSGFTIVLPRTGDGRHADYASALCAAIKHAANPRQEMQRIHIPGY